MDKAALPDRATLTAAIAELLSETEAFGDEQRAGILVAEFARHLPTGQLFDDLEQAAATITRLVRERDEAREGLDRLEAAYGILSDDVFGAHPKIAAMASELSEAKAQRDAALADVLDRMSRIAARYNRLIARIPKELDHAGEDKP